MEAEAVEEHLFAEDVHFLNSDEQGNRSGANDGAGPSTNQQVTTGSYLFHQVGINLLICGLLLCQTKAKASHVKQSVFFLYGI